MQKQKALEAQILDILDREYSLLVKADFDLMPDLLRQKEELIAEIITSDGIGSPKDLARIRDLARRNDRLFLASLEGIRNAIEKISDVRSSFGRLKTYDGHGKISMTVTATPKVSVKS